MVRLQQLFMFVKHLFYGEDVLLAFRSQSLILANEQLYQFVQRVHFLDANQRHVFNKHGQLFLLCEEIGVLEMGHEFVASVFFLVASYFEAVVAAFIFEHQFKLLKRSSQSQSLNIALILKQHLGQHISSYNMPTVRIKLINRGSIIYNNIMLGEKTILLIKQSQQVQIRVDEKMLTMSMLQLIDFIYSKHGYTPRIYLYHHPLSAFGKLSFISLATSVSKIISLYPSICFTYNNTQFIEEAVKLENGGSFIFLIVQAKYDNCFHYQTFKISLDCKMLFIKAITQTYGRFSYMAYFDLLIPLDYFQANQLVEGILKKYLHIANYMVVIVQTEQVPKLYKSTGDLDIVDKENFIVLGVQQELIVMNKQAVSGAALELLSFLVKKELRLPNCRQLQNATFRQLGLNYIQLLYGSRHQTNLQKPIKNSIFIGTTSSYLCFVQQSHILHIFQNQPPFGHVNSAILNCQPNLYLEQQIPVLMRDQLIMYNITISTITLKYYALPLGAFKYSNHFNWYSKLYSNLRCSCLDVIAVNYKNSSRIRVFYIYSPNDFIQTESISSNWDISVSKHGKNNFSDGSGLIAVYWSDQNQVQIFNLKQKQKVHRFYTLRLKRVCFSHQKPLVLVVGAENWIQYDFSKKTVEREGKNQRLGDLEYSPNNRLMLLSDKHVTLIEGKNAEFRVESALMKEGKTFFSKNVQNKFCSYTSVFELEDNSLSTEQFQK